MNKTIIAGVFLCVILGAICGNVVLGIFAPAQLTAFNGSVITILGVGSAGIVTIYGLGKQGEKLEQIQKQTNGTLSGLRQENTELRETNAALREQLVATGAVEPSGGGDHVA